MSKRALIYTRVSKDDTGEGASNQRQEQKCQALAELRGYSVVGVEADISISAYTGKTRPGWQRVLDAIDKGEVDVVLAYHLDRLTRSMTDLETLISLAEQRNVGVVTVTGDIDLTTDVGRMVARILAAVARAEVERKGARQRLANEQRAVQGKRWPSGPRPFGYTNSGEVVEAEAEAIRRGAQWLIEGVSVKEIGRRWEASGLRSPLAKEGAPGWTPRGVKFVLSHPRNIGVSTYKGKHVGVGDWEPILDDATHAAVLGVLNDPRRTTYGKGGRTPQNLLTSIATCSVCGEGVDARKQFGRPVYGCKPGCTWVFREEADELVTEWVKWHLPPHEEPEAQGLDLDSIQGEMNAQVTRRGELAEAFKSGALDVAGYTAAASAVSARIKELEAEAAKSEVQRNIRYRATSTFTALPLLDRRALLSDYTLIRVLPRNRKNNVPTENVIEIDLHMPDGWKLIYPPPRDHDADE